MKIMYTRGDDLSSLKPSPQGHYCHPVLVLDGIYRDADGRWCFVCKEYGEARYCEGRTLPPPEKTVTLRFTVTGHPQEEDEVVGFIDRYAKREIKHTSDVTVERVEEDR